jgi:hypothetical protein
MKAELTKEHEWLQKLVGEWEYELIDSCKPGEEPVQSKGTEIFRSLQGAWVVGEGHGTMGSVDIAITQITLGYDPKKGRFVGTWIGSMMTHLWVYDGELDSTGRVLTLNSTGPDFQDPNKTSSYRDIIEFVDDDHRLLRSETPDENGEWKEFMRLPYRRKP